MCGLIYGECNYSMELRERKKGKKNDRATVVLHTTMKVEDVRMCIETC
jgi:hypothetical protein